MTSKPSAKPRETWQDSHPGQYPTKPAIQEQILADIIEWEAYD